MLPTFLSSGDLIADRRADYARLLSESADHSAAAEVMEQALELVPDWAAGWSLLGAYREAGADLDGAVAAWRQVLRLDPADPFGAALKLAANSAGLPVEHTAQAYVEALFDGYAAGFEAALLQRLEYGVPERLSALVTGEMTRRGTGRLGHAIDAGCGTGLLGERLRRHVSFLEGVDLSAGMLAEAAGKGIYDRTAKAELVAWLGQGGEAADLIAAADVFCYCGALGPVLAAAAARLVSGGLLAFSVEAHEGPEAMIVRPSLRFAHQPEATRRALAAAGLEVLAMEAGPLRLDRGEPVPGLFVLAARAAVLPAAPAIVVAHSAGEAAATQ